MSLLSLGPQLQMSLNRSKNWRYSYKKFSAAYMADWSNYFKLNKNISLLAGLRADRSITSLDTNPHDRSIGNSFGLLMGVEYTFWYEKK